MASTTETAASTINPPSSTNPDEAVDAISLLRACLSSSSSPRYLDSNHEPSTSLSTSNSSFVLLSPHTHPIPLDIPTRLCSSRSLLLSSISSSPDGKLDLTIPPFLSLRNILFANEKAEETIGNYFRDCTREGFARLESLERNDVLAWLNGKRDEWEGVIDIEKVRKAGKNVPAPQTQASTQPQDSTSTTQTAPQPQSSTLKRTYVPNDADQQFVKKLRTEQELILRDHNHVLRGTILNPSSSSDPTIASSGSNLGSIGGLEGSSGSNSSGLNDFSTFRKNLGPKLEVMRKSVANKPANASSSTKSSRPTASSLNNSSTPSNPSTSNLGTKRKSRPLDPILLLSNSPTSLINMFNVKKLLEEGVFVPPDVARKQAGGVSEPVVSVIRTWGAAISSSNPSATAAAGGVRPLRFIVVDNSDMLAKLGAASNSQSGGVRENDVWNRVVTVFTTGQDWQFRNYKWNDGKELFKHVLGMYVRYNNDDKPASVKDWNVNELQVERTKRHTDKQLVAHFWRTVEGWIARRKPGFAP